MKKPLISLLALTLGASALLTTGCGANNDPVKEDPKATAQRVESATQMRSYFDKSSGNYDTLSTEDKAALDKITGGADKSKEAFSHMSASSSGGASAPGGGLPPSS